MSPDDVGVHEQTAMVPVVDVLVNYFLGGMASFISGTACVKLIPNKLTD